MRTKKSHGPPVGLLKELCGTDDSLYAVLSRYLYETPLAAIPETDLDVLTQEGEKSGNFARAMEKAIFEGAQKPEARGRYIEVIQNLASKTIRSMQRDKEAPAREEINDTAASLASAVEQQRILSERAEDVLDVAAKFYHERLLEHSEDIDRREREQQRKTVENREKRAERQEKTARDARRRDRKNMGRAERREAKRQQKQEDLAANQRKQVQEHQKKVARKEENRITEAEEIAREARREGRSEK